MKQRLAAHRASEIHGMQLGSYVQDIVYGGNDGIVTTFAVVASTVGADLPPAIIIVLGLANLFADAASMGGGSFLSTKSQRDQYRRLWKEELEEIRRHPELEKAEVREAFHEKGFEGKDLDRAVEVITADEEHWVRTMMVEEHGLTEEASERPAAHGIVTFLSFVAFGFIPIIPYFFSAFSAGRFLVAIASSLAALTALGATRSIITRERVIRGTLEVVVIGAIAGAIAYGVGVALRGLAEGVGV